MAWLDRSTTKRLHYTDLCDAIFGRNSARPDALSSSRQQTKQQQLLLQQVPPKPHVLQAQRSAALALGESSSNSGGVPSSGVAYPPPLPARVQELNRLAAEKQKRLGGKTAWNWQGRPPAAAAAEARHQELGGGEGKKNSDPGGSGAPVPGPTPVRLGGILKASGEAIVAEKARIEKRLKEVQRERALLLRDKNRMECWREESAGRGGATAASVPDAPPANNE